jgi:hypothetical protein
MDNSQSQGGNSAGGSGNQSGAGAGDQAGDLSQNSAGGQGGETSDTNNNPDGGGVREYDPVYAPNFIDGNNNDGQDIQLETKDGDQPLKEGEFQENPNGNVTVPYNEVFSDYANAASRALNQDYIPLGLKDVIRTYFSSLDPNQ